MTKKIFTTVLITLLLICFWSSRVNALSVKITEENLKETMDKMAERNGGDVEVSIENNKIIINEEKIGEGTTVIKYDLQGNPKFMFETEIKKNDDAIGNLMMHGYLMELYGVIAEIQGVDSSKAEDYISQYDSPLKYFYGLLEGNPDDYFEEIKNRFSTAYSFDDSDKYNTFSWTTKEQDVTDTSFKLVSTLSINSDADFSKIILSNTTEEKVEKPISSTTIKTTNENKTEVTQQNTQAKNTVTETILPKTGEIKDVLLITLYIIIAVSVVCLVVIVVKSKKQ